MFLFKTVAHFFSTQGVFFFFCIKYEPVTYANVYHYPWWGEVIGLILSFSSMIWIPGYAIYYLIKTPGSFKEVPHNFILLKKKILVRNLLREIILKLLFYILHCEKFLIIDMY